MQCRRAIRFPEEKVPTDALTWEKIYMWRDFQNMDPNQYFTEFTYIYQTFSKILSLQEEIMVSKHQQLIPFLGTPIILRLSDPRMIVHMKGPSLPTGYINIYASILSIQLRLSCQEKEEINKTGVEYLSPCNIAKHDHKHKSQIIKVT